MHDSGQKAIFKIHDDCLLAGTKRKGWSLGMRGRCERGAKRARRAPYGAQVKIRGLEKKSAGGSLPLEVKPKHPPHTFMGHLTSLVWWDPSVCVVCVRRLTLLYALLGHLLRHQRFAVKQLARFGCISTVVLGVILLRIPWWVLPVRTCTQPSRVHICALARVLSGVYKAPHICVSLAIGAHGIQWMESAHSLLRQAPATRASGGASYARALGCTDSCQDGSRARRRQDRFTCQGNNQEGGGRVQWGQRRRTSRQP